MLGSRADTIYGSIRSAFIRADMDGNLIDYKSYRPQNSFVYLAPFRAISLDVQDGIVTAGRATDSLGTAQKALLVKYDYNGDTIFTRQYAYPPPYKPQFYCACKSYDNGFLLAGNIVFDYTKYFLVKTDSAGNELWRKVIGNNNAYYLPSTVYELPNHDILIAGAYGGDPDAIAVDFYALTQITILDSVGTFKSQWTETDSNANAPLFFQPTSDGGYISCGNYITQRLPDPSPTWYAKGYIVKWDSNFNKQWEQKLGIPFTYGSTEAVVVKEAPDGSFYAVVHEVGPLSTIYKLSAQGDSIWGKRYAGVGQFYQGTPDFPVNQIFDLKILPDQSLLGVGLSANYTDTVNLPQQQAWILRIDSNGCISDTNCGLILSDETLPPSPTFANLKVFPNPFTSEITIQIPEAPTTTHTIEITNLEGKTIQTTKATYPTTTLPTANLSSGFYICYLKQKDQIISISKIIKQ